MRYRLKSLIALLIIGPVAIAWTHQTFFRIEETNKIEERDQSVLPIKILMNLETRFDAIHNQMNEKDVLNALGLANYTSYLSDNYSIMMSGAGWDLKVYTLSADGYQLEFRDFMGNQPECILRGPDNSILNTADIGQPVSSMEGFHEYINPKRRTISGPIRSE